MDDWQVEPEIIVRNDDEFFFSLEPYKRPNGDMMVFAHLTVRKWTKDVFKKILLEWNDFRRFVRCPVFAVVGDGDAATWEHFVTRLGFKFVMPVICNNGEERRLFVHHVTNKNKEDAQRTIATEHEQQPEHQLLG